MIRHILVAALTVTACTQQDSDAKLATANIARGDSLPIHADLTLFQSELPRQAHDLGTHAAASRDALFDQFVRAVEDSNAAVLRSLRLDVAEFAYLYYPPSRYTRAPYELPPATLWLLIEQNGLKGEARVLQHYGGRSLNVNGYRCEDEPRTEGPNRLWEHCLLERADDTGQRFQERLFGSILERDGKFKFVSIANRL